MTTFGYDCILLYVCFSVYLSTLIFFFFFFNDTATTEIYTLSLHDALPICPFAQTFQELNAGPGGSPWNDDLARDRKSTRLNSSHLVISYAVFCLKKKKNIINLPAHHYIDSCQSTPHLHALWRNNMYAVSTC